MFRINRILLSVALLFLLLSIQSNADTYVVTNLNDPGAGSLRQAINDSNSNAGPDTIVFEEGLEGTIVLNVGSMFINDDLTITGPGADTITIDADGDSNIFDIFDFDDEINRVVKISGLRFINGSDARAGAILNSENLQVDSCQFINGSADVGGAIENNKILSVSSCLFENNSATFGGAISNEGGGVNVKIIDSEFRNNEAPWGGVIRNDGSIDFINNSTFRQNIAIGGQGGAIQNTGIIKEISNSTFESNESDLGGAIYNVDALIESIVNSTFTKNMAISGNAIRNNNIINISFSTIANNPSLPLPPDSPFTMERGGLVTVGNGVTRIRNSVISDNSPDNCLGFPIDSGHNYSNDFSCGFTGDGSDILLGPLADNGGPTETMALLGGDPLDGATVNCDALNAMGNPAGIPIGLDQRYFPRPFGVRCDSGAFETQPTASVTITKVTDPAGGTGFDFDSNGFGSLQGCGLRGDGGNFSLNDGDSINCIVPEGDYSITEDMPPGYDLTIFCLEAPDNLTINNQTGEINFAIEDPGADVDCIYTNTKTGGGGNGGCTLAPSGTNYMFPLYLFAPALILMRRLVKKRRE